MGRLLLEQAFRGEPGYNFSMATPALMEVRNLRKQFKGGVQAVNGVSFSVPEGKCFGLLGPNGAGKTTTIEIMEGIKEASSGEIYFRGQPRGHEFKRKVGIQFQETSLPDFLTVREVIKLFSAFYEKPLPLEELVKLCHLQDFLDRETDKLSGGQRQRVLLALALVNDPEIVFLDEPTTGLDPQARRNFWDLVRSIKARNKTLILTTHYMEEAYILCDEIIIMDQGKILIQGPPDRLLAEHFQGVSVLFPKSDLTETQLSQIRTETDLITSREDHYEIQTHHLEQFVGRLQKLGIPLKGMRVRSQTLEDLFLKLTGKELRA